MGGGEGKVGLLRRNRFWGGGGGGGFFHFSFFLIKNFLILDLLNDIDLFNFCVLLTFPDLIYLHLFLFCYVNF